MSANPAKAVDRAWEGHPLRRRSPPFHGHLTGILAITVAASFASTGCGKEDAPEPVVPIMSCDLDAIAECDEVIGAMSIMQLSSAQWSCTSRGGTYSFTTRCPTTAVVGTCSIAHAYGGADLVERYYAPTDPAAAQASCARRFGVWTPSQ